MSVTDYVKDKANGVYDNFKWNMSYASPLTVVFYPFWWIMRRERGREFPFYFPDETAVIHFELDLAYAALDDVVHAHESDRNPAVHNKTLVNRLKYAIKNFHFYSNDTMANLFFSTKLPLRDYQRIKSTYLQLTGLFMLYNTFSGVFLVALTNHFFRGRKTTLPTVFVASVALFAGFVLNYKASYTLMDSALNNSVRRLGHKELVHRYGGKYPRNIEFTSLLL